MRIIPEFSRIFALLAVFLLVSSTLEAKKPVKKKKPAKVSFTTDWKNADSIQYHLELRKAMGDYSTAIRLTDSLMSLPGGQSGWNLLQIQKANLLDSADKKNDLLLHLQSWYASLKTTDSLSKYASELAIRLSKAGDLKSALELSEFMNHEKSEKIEALVKSLAESELAENKKKEELEGKLKQSIEDEKSMRILLWIFVILAVIALSGCVFLLMKRSRMLRQHDKLGAQMDHTRTQIEKAFEEGDRINAEIRTMKEQVARIEAEKKYMRQNIESSTAETLPLLKQQLDALARENPGNIPVEKYMAIQNTITRLNKQLRDLS